MTEQADEAVDIDGITLIVNSLDRIEEALGGIGIILANGVKVLAHHRDIPDHVRASVQSSLEALFNDEDDEDQQ